MNKLGYIMNHLNKIHLKYSTIIDGNAVSVRQYNTYNYQYKNFYMILFILNFLWFSLRW